MDTDSFIIHIETEDFYKDIADDIDKRFDTSAYNENDNRPLPIGINKKVIGKFKDELNGWITIRFCSSGAKTYALDMDDDTEIKKAKGAKKCVIKYMLKFDDYKEAVFENKTILRSQQTFKSDEHCISTKEINKIAIRNNDDKRYGSFDPTTTKYQYGTPAVKVCEAEMLTKIKK